MPFRSLLLTVLLLGCFLASPARAQEPSARAFVIPEGVVGVGRQFVVNVEVSGAQTFEREPPAPDLSSFAQFLGSSTQSSVRMVNGRTSVSITIQYRFQALSEGTFTVPAVPVSVADRSLSTSPLELTISASAPQGDDVVSAIGPDDLFITAEASTSSALVGEPVIVEYRIWTRLDVTRFGMARVPEPEGFWVEDLTRSGQPEVEQLMRDGRQYASAVIRRIALIPTSAGPRTVEPIGLEAEVRLRGTRDPFESFFGRRSLFGGGAVTTTVLSNPLSIDVAPLPPGQPEPFTGVVEASLDRDSVDANGAATLTVRVTGEGNLRAVPPPVLDLPEDFEAFPPEIDESMRETASGLAGTKTFEYVLIARAPGRREIPPIRLGYFDRGSGEYGVALSDPLTLTVAGTVAEGSAPFARGGVTQLREDIRFIRLGGLELRRSGGSVFGGAGFWMFFLLPLAATGGAFALRRHQDLLEGDVAYARGRRAGRVARRRLAEARRLAAEDDPRAFYGEVARALRGLIADRLNVAEAGLLTSELDASLGRAGVDDATRASLRDCLEHCDRQRFAPSGSGGEERSRILEQASELMVALDRRLR